MYRKAQHCPEQETLTREYDLGSECDYMHGNDGNSGKNKNKKQNKNKPRHQEKLFMMRPILSTDELSNGRRKVTLFL